MRWGEGEPHLPICRLTSWPPLALSSGWQITNPDHRSSSSSSSSSISSSSSRSGSKTPTPAATPSSHPQTQPSVLAPWIWMALEAFVGPSTMRNAAAGRTTTYARTAVNPATSSPTVREPPAAARPVVPTPVSFPPTTGPFPAPGWSSPTPTANLATPHRWCQKTIPPASRSLVGWNNSPPPLPSPFPCSPLPSGPPAGSRPAAHPHPCLGRFWRI